MNRNEIFARLDELRKQRAARESAMIQTRTAFEERRKALEARLEALTEEASDDERVKGEEEITAFKAEENELKKQETSEKVELDRLDGEIAQLESEIEAIDERAKRGAQQSANGSKPKNKNINTKRKETNSMKKSYRNLFSSIEERNTFFARKEVTDFIDEVREMAKRGVTNGSVTVPEIVLDVITPSIEKRSKLLKHVNLTPLSGDGRVPVLGDIPEGVWTETCAKINELDLNFAMVEIGSNKVGGFVPVCKALINDSVIKLGTVILNVLAASIAKAIDKAIGYGTGTKMPLGIVTRLAQTSDPHDNACTVPWVDLHSTNIKTIANTYTGKEFYAKLVEETGAIDSDNADERMVAAMNHKTKTWLIAQALAFDASGALKASVDNVVPGIDADIEEISDIPDYNILLGYGEFYSMGERGDVELATSEHVRFIEDQIVYKATARYDGRPAKAKAFMLIGVNGTSPTTELSFRPDYANTAMNTLTVTAAAGSAAGKTVLTVTGATSGNTLKYAIGDLHPAVGSVPAGTWSDLTSGSTAITAAAGTKITVVELDGNGVVVGRGDVLSVPKTN